MKIIRVQTLRNQGVIADKCNVAERFWERAVGLIGRKEFRSGEGMFFPQCNNIHMWFMRLPIDVVFLKESRSVDGRSQWWVTSVRKAIKPWRILPVMDIRANDTLELPSGTIEKWSIQAGDEMCLS